MVGIIGSAAETVFVSLTSAHKPTLMFGNSGILRALVLRLRIIGSKATIYVQITASSSAMNTVESPHLFSSDIHLLHGHYVCLSDRQLSRSNVCA